MIDWSQVRSLHNEVGPDDFEEVVVLCFEEVEEITTRLCSAANPERTEADLHSLLGSALALGFTDLAALCEKGENLCAQGKSDQVDMRALRDGFAAIQKHFSENLAENLAENFGGQTSL
ncbi:MAG: Hpt domain-containing protein [Sulfitobacter sp.]